MLSRTAENLFWMGRYMERAEMTARLLDVGSRITLLPSSAGQGFRDDWDSLLQASGTAEGFRAKYGETVQRNIESYLFFDRDNPSSVASCIERARENGRIVRTALTSQVWDALNTAFQELRQLEKTERGKLELSRLTEWTTRHTSMLRGAIAATKLRDDGYHFLGLGSHIERADNTARLLDVKYYVLLPKADYVGSGLDTHQWMTLLRALSAQRAFHWAYGGEITAAKVVHFLILNRRMPRSLYTSLTGAHENLSALAEEYDRRTPAQTRAATLMQDFSQLTVEEVFDEGLHEFLTRFVGEMAGLASLVQDQYLSGEAR
ncbi:alpha-E domain-containing protein [Frigidibacter sp. RF13]|uniref:alpha-E domain-containing protein n=1 Tax=Frigidibacter sp. RF13 TaxID=2997340 RepID=UPI00226D9257|nr:alpha-E domain-containing protein [Frigidibacter sp. RF13]MCY1125788.1 alpha-E domain-containing protein [Frigidibacter sp. RF13]